MSAKDILNDALIQRIKAVIEKALQVKVASDNNLYAMFRRFHQEFPEGLSNEFYLKVRARLEFLRSLPDQSRVELCHALGRHTEELCPGFSKQQVGETSWEALMERNRNVSVGSYEDVMASFVAQFCIPHPH